MKYLLVFVVVVVVLWLLGSRMRRRDGDAPAASRRKPDAAGGAPMISCAVCGLHVPEGEALRDAGGRAYCGEEHRRLGAG